MTQFRLWLLVLLFSLPFSGQAAQSDMVVSDYSTSRLLSEVDTVAPGKPFWVMLHIRLKPDWHTYWKNPGDSGIPTTLKWTLPEGFKAGPLQFLAPEREPYAGLLNYGYHDDAWYLAQITPPSSGGGGEVKLEARAGWLICKDICIPEGPSFVLTLKRGADMQFAPEADEIREQVAKLPQPRKEAIAFTEKDHQLLVTLPAEMRGKRVVFFPDDSMLIKNAAEQKQEDGVLSLARDEGKLPEQVKGVLSVYDDSRSDYEVVLKSGTAAATASPPVAADKLNILSAMLLALVGGLILNLMPCVFPVLSLKALDIARKAGKADAHVRAKGLAYTSGVLLSFLLMASVLVVLRGNGAHVGWYQMQSPLYVGILAYILFLVALNLSGLFELPVLFGNVGGHTAGKDTLLGSFLTGVLAVAVATPCTGPYMAPAIGYAFTQPAAVVIAVFLSLGLGLALPFLLISFVPATRKFLPRPGAWMARFKEFLAFPMYLTVVWLLWVLMQQIDMQQWFFVAVGLVLTGFAIWLARVLEHKPLVRWIACGTIALIALSPIYLLPVSADMRMSECAVKTSDREMFSTSALAKYRAVKKPVFVDATAAWCINCKINEQIALSSDRIRRAFQEKGIIYMVADWTRRDDEITRYLASFGRSGVPLYVYYPPGGEPKVLPQILTEQTVLDAIQ